VPSPGDTAPAFHLRDEAAANPGNPVFHHIQAGFERHHVSYPEFMAVHYMVADDQAGERFAGCQSAYA
jgi:hypothetical protein